MSQRHEIGWCHNCETWQLLRDAPWLPNPYTTAHELTPCCVTCREEEPWDFGVFDMERPDVGAPVSGKWGVFAVKTCARQHAERQDVSYGCDCPPVEVQRFPVVRTHCRDCEERSEQRVIGFTRSGGLDWEADRARPCRHWREHGEAARRAVGNKTGRGGRGPVRAEVSYWR